jgi:putative salt-induced outer membrane protein YdiY
MRAFAGIGVLLLILMVGCAAPVGKGSASAPVDDYDWIQLTSGEWLKGHIKSLKQFSLEFDSDKLKDLTIDWEDIKTLHTAKASCLFGNKQVLVGAVAVDEKSVTVTSDDEVRQFPRSELRTISPGDLSERNYWSGDLSLGSTYRTGNTNQAEVTAQANVQRRTPESTLALTYLGNYGRVDGQETSNNDRVGTNFDLTLTNEIFVRPFLGQYYHDPLQNISQQATVSAGMGYYFFNDPHSEWDAFVGPAFQYTRFGTVEPGQSIDNSTPALVFQTSFDTSLTQRLDLLLTYQGILTSDDAGKFTQHALGTLQFKLTRLLDLNLSLIWDSTDQPPPNSSGRVPKQDDFQTVLSLGIRF